MPKLQVGRMLIWQNDKSMKCQVDKMASWQNGKLTKWQVDKMASWQNVKLTKCQVVGNCDSFVKRKISVINETKQDEISLKSKV